LNVYIMSAKFARHSKAGTRRSNSRFIHKCVKGYSMVAEWHDGQA